MYLRLRRFRPLPCNLFLVVSRASNHLLGDSRVSLLEYHLLTTPSRTFLLDCRLSLVLSRISILEFSRLTREHLASLQGRQQGQVAIRIPLQFLRVAKTLPEIHQRTLNNPSLVITLLLPIVTTSNPCLIISLPIPSKQAKLRLHLVQVLANMVMLQLHLAQLLVNMAMLQFYLAQVQFSMDIIQLQMVAKHSLE